MTCVFVGLFYYFTKNGDLDDLETPAYKILLDDDNDLNKVQPIETKKG